jgi:autotransporter-associated beta strand protein
LKPDHPIIASRVSRFRPALPFGRAVKAGCALVAALGAINPLAAETYQWNGTSDGVWTNPANWNETGTPAGITKGPGPSGGNFIHRLNVNNGAANALIYDTLLGATLYGGTGIRGLVIGSGSAGTMRITGGTFDTTNSSIQDVISSSGVSSESWLRIDGGAFRSRHLLLGLNNPSRNTLTVSQGGAVIDTIDFNVQDGNATVNLDGGSLETKWFKISTSTPAASTNAFNFNGGILKAGASSATFFPDLARTSAIVKSGGAFIDTNGFDITIAEALTEGGGGGLTKSGPGVLTLTSPATFSGPTAVHGGTLALGPNGSLAASSAFQLAAGAACDVSAIPSYTWPASTPFTSAGGDLSGGTVIDLGNTALTLDFTPTSFSGDSSHPALTVSTGSLVLNGPLAVNNHSASPLGAGTYILISQASGSITGNPTFSGSVGGQGIEAGNFCFVRIVGGNLELVVQSPVSTITTLARDSGIPSSSTYGDALRFIVSVTPPTATGTVELRNGGPQGTLLGAAALAGGSAVITVPGTALAPGTHANLVARYLGSASHLHGESPPLSPAQSVSARQLTIQLSLGSIKAAGDALNRYPPGNSRSRARRRSTSITTPPLPPPSPAPWRAWWRETR